MFFNFYLIQWSRYRLPCIRGTHRKVFVKLVKVDLVVNRHLKDSVVNGVSSKRRYVDKHSKW